MSSTPYHSTEEYVELGKIAKANARQLHFSTNSKVERSAYTQPFHNLTTHRHHPFFSTDILRTHRLLTDGSLTCWMNLSILDEESGFFPFLKFWREINLTRFETVIAAYLLWPLPPIRRRWRWPSPPYA